MNSYDIKLPRTVPIVADTEIGPVAVSIEIDWVQDDDEDGDVRNHALVSQRHALAEINAEVILRQRRSQPGGDAEEEDNVPTAQLRGAFENQKQAGEITAYTLAARMGWTRKKAGERVPDVDRVQDVLGITRERRTIPYDTACQLAACMNIDPVEVGL